MGATEAWPHRRFSGMSTGDVYRWRECACHANVLSTLSSARGTRVEKATLMKGSFPGWWLVVSGFYVNISRRRSRFCQLVSEMLVELLCLRPLQVRSAPSPREAPAAAPTPPRLRLRRRRRRFRAWLYRPRAPRSRHARRIPADARPELILSDYEVPGLMVDKQARIRSIDDEAVTPADLVLGRRIAELCRELGNSGGVLRAHRSNGNARHTGHLTSPRRGLPSARDRASGR